MKTSRQKVIDDLAEKYLEAGRLGDALGVARLGISSSTADSIMRECVGRGRYQDALGVAHLASGAEIDSLVGGFVSEGDVNGARLATRSRNGGAFSVGEIDGLVMNNLNLHGVHEAIKAAGMGASQSVVEKLITFSLERDPMNAESIAKVVALRPSGRLTSDEVERLITRHISGSCVYAPSVMEAVAFRDPGVLTTEEREMLVVGAIRSGRIDNAEVFSDLRPQPGLSSQEMKALFRGCLDNSRLRGALDLLEGFCRPNWGQGPEEVEMLIGACVKRGELDQALEAVKLRSSQALTPGEIDEITRRLIQARCLEDAYESAKKGTSREVTDTLLLACLVQGPKKSLGWGEVELALRVARLGVSPPALNMLIQVYINADNVKGVMEAVNLRLSKRLTMAELRMLGQGASRRDSAQAQ